MITNLQEGRVFIRTPAVVRIDLLLANQFKPNSKKARI
jgi:hypothetical protein